MSEIYVLDFNYHRLSDSEIQSIIRSKATSQPTEFTSTGKGIIAKFNTEEDSNFIFAPDTVRHFLAKSLYASLSPNTQKERNIYIPQPPPYIYNQPEYAIITEIQNNNHTAIVGLKKFESKQTGRKFFILTPINNAETQKLASIGKISLFGVELPAEAKKNAPTNRARGTSHHMARGSTQQMTGVHLTASHRPGQSTGPPGPVTNHSYWTGPQNNYNQHRPVNQASYGLMYQGGSYPNISRTNGPPPHLNGPPPAASIGNTAGIATSHNGTGSQANNAAASHEPNQQVSTTTWNQTSLMHQNEQSMKLYSYNLVNLCERLSNGIETPELFIDNFNQILSENGMNTIKVPKPVIDASKMIYSSNQPKGPSTHNSTPTTTPTSTPTSTPNPSTPILTSNTSIAHSPSTTASYSTSTVSHSSTSSNTSTSQAPVIITPAITSTTASSVLTSSDPLTSSNNMPISATQVYAPITSSPPLSNIIPEAEPPPITITPSTPVQRCITPPYYSPIVNGAFSPVLTNGNNISATFVAAYDPPNSNIFKMCTPISNIISNSSHSTPVESNININLFKTKMGWSTKKPQISYLGTTEY